jgi:hypothetical protein
MNLDELVAIDTHTHAEVSCCQPKDPHFEPYERAADKYFGRTRTGRPSTRPSPTTASARSAW